LYFLVCVNSFGQTNEFLILPFKDTQVQIAQGYVYDGLPGNHKAIDYFKEISGQWVGFEVIASASGRATTFYHSGLGYTVIIAHDDFVHDPIRGENLRYYTLYAHLKDDSNLVGCEKNGNELVCSGVSLNTANNAMKTDDFTGNEWFSVEQGQTIGTAWKTGVNSNSYIHLHYQVVLGDLDSPRKAADPYGIEKKFKTNGVENYPGCGNNTEPYLWTQCPPTGDLPIANNSLYGSIYADQFDLFWGFSNNQPTQDIAKSVAQTFCEDLSINRCLELVSFFDTCASIYSGTILYARTGDTIELARQNTLNACSSAEGGFCFHETSFCSK